MLNVDKNQAALKVARSRKLADKLGYLVYSDRQDVATIFAQAAHGRNLKNCANTVNKETESDLDLAPEFRTL